MARAAKANAPARVAESAGATARLVASTLTSVTALASPRTVMSACSRVPSLFIMGQSISTARFAYRRIDGLGNDLLAGSIPKGPPGHCGRAGGAIELLALREANQPSAPRTDHGMLGHRVTARASASCHESGTARPSQAPCGAELAPPGDPMRAPKEPTTISPATITPAIVLPTSLRPVRRRRPMGHNGCLQEKPGHDTMFFVSSEGQQWGRP